MRFQPFGYGFEICSPKTPDAVKSAIRAKKVGWFETRNGPRGWIVGPLICLWNSAFDSYGPMVIARIAKDGAGSRVFGRAGSDLNGLLMLAFLTPFLIVMLVAMANEEASPYFFFLLILFGLGIPAAFWWGHTDKREADPLVRFIRRTIESPSAKSIMRVPSTGTGTPVARLIDENGNDLPATEESVRDAVKGLGVDSFVILEIGPEEYMQLLSRKDDFLLEKREGNADQHYRCVLQKGDRNDSASYDQNEGRLVKVLTDYLFGRCETHPVSWELTKV